MVTILSTCFALSCVTESIFMLEIYKRLDQWLLSLQDARTQVSVEWV